MSNPNNLNEIREQLRTVREGLIDKSVSHHEAAAVAKAAMAEAKLIQEFRRVAEFVVKNKPDADVDLDVFGLVGTARSRSLKSA